MEEFRKRKAISKFLKMRNFPTSVYLDRKGLMDLFGSSQIYTEHKKILKEFFRDHKKDKINGNKGEEVVH